MRTRAPSDMGEEAPGTWRVPAGTPVPPRDGSIARPQLPDRSRVLVALAVVVVLGVLAVSWATRTTSSSWTESLDERLLDAGAGTNAAALVLEQSHLQAYRAMAFTQGFPDDLAELDVEGIRERLTPVDANLTIPMIDIIDEQGRVVFAFRSEGAVPPVYRDRRDLELVRRVVAGEADERGDRFSELISTSEGPLIATAGPVRRGEQIVGAVLVMTPLDQLLGQAHNAHGVHLTAYSIDRGDAMATTAPARPGSLGSDLRGELAARPESLPYAHSFHAADRQYREQIGALVLRGRNAAYIGAALPDRADQLERNVIVAAIVTAGAIVLAAFLVVWLWRSRGGGAEARRGRRERLALPPGPRSSA